jgi:uncharacterized phage protein (TIGR02220 family)
MAKDPAFLFYPNDYIGGTMGMTFEEKGAYIELLMLQFNRGHMTCHMIGQVVGQLWVKLQDKFCVDENGLYYNIRLENEIEKRKCFVASRNNNIKGVNGSDKNRGRMTSHMTGHMTSHMENENEDVNKDIVSISIKDTKDKEIREIIEYLNSKTGTSYRYTSEKTKSLIRARFNDKFSIEDFYSVIDKKTDEWINTEQEKYLRPETLFGTKFESYVNQKNGKLKTMATGLYEIYKNEEVKSEQARIMQDPDDDKCGISEI